MTSSRRPSDRTERPGSTPSQRAFAELAKRVGGLLREHGFRGSGQNFTRDCGELWQGVALQRSQWVVSAHEPVRFYLNFGVYFATLRSEQFDWRKTFTEFRSFRPASMDLSLRPSELGQRAPSVWEVGEDTLEQVWEQVQGVLRLSVLPVLDWVSTRDGATELCLLIPWHLDLAVRAWLGTQAPKAWAPNEVEAERLRQALSCRIQTLDKPVARPSRVSARSRKVNG